MPLIPAQERELHRHLKASENQAPHLVELAQSPG